MINVNGIFGSYHFCFICHLRFILVGIVAYFSGAEIKYNNYWFVTTVSVKPGLFINGQTAEAIAA